jgi:ATP-dependent protease ClpP protease subunit
MAQRWVVKAHIDDNTCDPCSENNGKLYRNRADAYADYPNGRGYVKCVGAEYGNDCRCQVVKRGKSAKGGSNMGRDLASLISKAQALTAGASARNLIAMRPDGAPPFAAMQDFRAEGNALYLYDAIGGWDGTRAIDVAQALAGMTGPVALHINSPGGIIFEGAAMYNAIRAYTGGPVTSWIDGYAASAASFVALAASPYDAAADTGGVRIADNGFMMVHDGMGLAMGTADDMRDVADLLDMLSDSIAQIYANRAGGTADEWRDVMRDGDTWYSASAAMDAKLVDVVVGKAEDDPAIEESAATNALDIGMFSAGGPHETCACIQSRKPHRYGWVAQALKGAMPA